MSEEEDSGSSGGTSTSGSSPGGLVGGHWPQRPFALEAEEGGRGAGGGVGAGGKAGCSERPERPALLWPRPAQNGVE